MKIYKTVMLAIIAFNSQMAFAELKEKCDEFAIMKAAAEKSGCFSFNDANGAFTPNFKAENFKSLTIEKDGWKTLKCKLNRRSKGEKVVKGVDNGMSTDHIKIIYKTSDDHKLQEIKLTPQPLVWQWVAPHGAAYLALQQLFRKKAHAFFSYDEKGQCYRLAEKPKDASETKNTELVTEEQITNKAH